MAKAKQIITSSSIKLIENNIIKLDKCVKILEQLLDRISDEEVKSMFLLIKNDIILKRDNSKVALENAKKLTLMPKKDMAL